MPKVEQNNISTSSSIPISLHYALTNSQCSKCGKQLEWEADFNNITQPKYTSKHCNQDYIIRIDTVKVETIGREDYSLREEEEKQKQVHDLSSSIEEKEEEPRAIKMAQALQKEERESEQIDTSPEKIIEEEK
jgi:NAD-dependent SIR2 family protein deacetylase